MKKSPTFLFDIGNVIIRFDFEIAIRKVAAQCETSAAQIFEKLHPLTDQFEIGEFDTSEFFSQAKAIVGFSGTESDFVSAFEDIFELNQPVADLISRLSAAGHRLLLLSNTNPIHVPFFTKTWPDVFGKFDDRIYSYEVKMMKPDSAIFDHTISVFGLDPSDTIYIDDRADNCEAGRASGLQTHCYDFADHEVLEKFVADFVQR